MAPSLSKLAPSGGMLGMVGQLITQKISTLNTQEVLMLAAIGASSASLYKGNIIAHKDQVELLNLVSTLCKREIRIIKYLPVNNKSGRNGIL